MFFFATCLGQAESIRLEASIEQNKVSVGNPLYLYVTFYGGQDIDQLDIPSVDGLQIKYVGPSTEVSIVNGKVSQSITHTYLVYPRKEGTFEIGPFFADYGGKTYKADAVILNVSSIPSQVPKSTPYSGTPVKVPSQPASTLPPGSGMGASYVGDKIFLTMDIDKRKVYINEIVPLTIKVYVDGLGLKDIEYPVYSHEGFSAGEFATPEKRRETVRGRSYDVLVFRQNLFGIKEGNYVLGPARLRCKLVVRKRTSRSTSIFGSSIFDDDFFSSRFGYETYPVDLESEEIPVTILPFPKENRPVDFQGAVGDFSMDVYIDPSEVKVGDPVVVRMVVRGEGDLDTVTVPQLSSTQNFKTYESEVTKKGDKKTYEQILIPKTTTVEEVPPVSFSFFNPTIGRYETIRKGPFPLKVMEQPDSEKQVKMVSMPEGGEIFYPREELGKDIIYIKESIGKLQPKGYFLYKNWLFWAFQVAAFFFFAAFYRTYKEKQRILSDKSYARFLRAPRKARSGMAKAQALLGKENALLFYDAIFKTLQDYLGDRFDLAKGNIASGVIEKRLEPVGRDEEMINMMRDVFSACEMARYASSGSADRRTKEDILDKVKRIIDYMEKAKI